MTFTKAALQEHMQMADLLEKKADAKNAVKGERRHDENALCVVSTKSNGFFLLEVSSYLEFTLTKIVVPSHVRE